MNKILVYLETQNNNLKRVSYELITAARGLAEKSSASIAGVIINGNAAILAGTADYGLSEVYNIANDKLAKHSSTAFSTVVAQVAAAVGADCVLFAANSAGLELAPRVAAKIQAGYISDVVALNFNGNELIAKKPVYGGKAVISTKINTASHVYSLRPNVFTATKSQAPANLNINEFNSQLGEKDFAAVVANVARNEGKLDVSEADIIVSGGRGIKGPEHYSLIEDLASALGGAVGASRAVVDAGWRPHAEQVGQTGKTVSPTLYVACGISGAVQHLAGMSTSKIILAINKDKDAPIFKVTDYGIVGDLFDVLPKLTANIKHLKG